MTVFLFLSADLYYTFPLLFFTQAQLFFLQCFVVKEGKKIQTVVTRYFLLGKGEDWGLHTNLQETSVSGTVVLN